MEPQIQNHQVRMMLPNGLKCGASGICFSTACQRGLRIDKPSEPLAIERVVIDDHDPVFVRGLWLSGHGLSLRDWGVVNLEFLDLQSSSGDDARNGASATGFGLD